MERIYLLMAVLMVGINAEAELSGYSISDVIPLAEGEKNDTIDFGFYRNGTGKIGNFVWNDLNWDGIQDPGEPGINDVKVYLIDVDRKICIAETTTKSELGDDGIKDGIYWFTGLKPGNYKVVVNMSTLPNDFIGISPKYAISDISRDSNAVDKNETNPCDEQGWALSPTP